MVESFRESASLDSVQKELLMTKQLVVEMKESMERMEASQKSMQNLQMYLLEKVVELSKGESVKKNQWIDPKIYKKAH